MVDQTAFSFPTSNLPIEITIKGKINSDEQAKTLSPTISMQQTHSDHLQVVTEPRTQVLLDTDAALTTLANVTLQVKTADCLPILIYHPLSIIGVVHAGRKGTKQKILQKTLKYINQHFDIKNKLEIFFGPCICSACYQVDRVTDLHYDLINENMKQILSLFNSSQANIWLSHQCTCHQPEKYYSYRREGEGVQMNTCSIRLTE